MMLNLRDPKSMTILARVALVPGEKVPVSVTSRYLVSEGQRIDLVIDLDHTPSEPGSRLVDGRELRACASFFWNVPPSWDQMPVPSPRSVIEILNDVIRHGEDSPDHGINCACMDRFIRELRNQVSVPIPPDMGDGTQAEIHTRVDAKARIRHVLGCVVRALG